MIETQRLINEIKQLTEERDKFRKALNDISDIYCDDNYHDWCGCVTKAVNIAEKSLTPPEPSNVSQ